ncbi:hypothetical protein P7C70_g3875, partial [Phenoliferia sp. Uapishka_3]
MPSALPQASVGISGFGRIGAYRHYFVQRHQLKRRFPSLFHSSGRAAFRASLDRTDLQVVAINHTAPTLSYLLHSIRYDSTHGTCPHSEELAIEDGALVFQGRRITLFSERDPSKLDWASVGAEYIIESTGKMLTVESAMQHVKSGAKKVVISAPSKDAKTIVVGVNRKDYTKDMQIISNASCTTNCLAPLAKVINKAFGIEWGMMTTASFASLQTVHASTSSQHILDGYSKKSRRLGRGVGSNIIPTTTGAATAVQLVLPELAGKFTGISIRVPVNNVSMASSSQSRVAGCLYSSFIFAQVDLTVSLTRPAGSKADLLAPLRAASLHPRLGNILCVNDDELVSSDFLGFKQSCIIDSAATIMLNENTAKIIAWYDNEWSLLAGILCSYPRSDRPHVPHRQRYCPVEVSTLVLFKSILLFLLTVLGDELSRVKISGPSPSHSESSIIHTGAAFQVSLYAPCTVRDQLISTYVHTQNRNVTRLESSRNPLFGLGLVTPPGLFLTEWTILVAKFSWRSGRSLHSGELSPACMGLSSRRELLLFSILFVSLFIAARRVLRRTSKSDLHAGWASSPFLSPAEETALPLLHSILTFSLSSHIPVVHPSFRYATSTPIWPLPTSADFSLILPPPPNIDNASSTNHERESFITLCGIASHESRYLVEWLTWHRLIGVERFILFDIVPGGDQGHGSGTLRELLRPWREEGVVTLVEVGWRHGNVPDTWHNSLLEIFNTQILPRVNWALHIDVDEFLLPPIPSAETAFPSSFLPSYQDSYIPQRSVSEKGEVEWFYALHERLHLLERAVCVPVFRVDFANVQLRAVNGDEEWQAMEVEGKGGPGREIGGKGAEWATVTDLNDYRVNWGTDGQWGKVFIHPEYKIKSATWGGARKFFYDTYTMTESNVVDDSHTFEPFHRRIRSPESDYLSIKDYAQRTLSNCFDKLRVLGKKQNWRTDQGETGCLDRFVNSTSLETKLASKQIVRDARMQESWEGRMTKVLIAEWWDERQGQWRWMGKRGDKGQGVVKIQL